MKLVQCRGNFSSEKYFEKFLILTFIYRTCVRACIVDKVLRVQLRNLERIGNGCLLKAFKGKELHARYS